MWGAPYREGPGHVGESFRVCEAWPRGSERSFWPNRFLPDCLSWFTPLSSSTVETGWVNKNWICVLMTHGTIFSWETETLTRLRWNECEVELLGDIAGWNACHWLQFISCRTQGNPWKTWGKSDPFPIVALESEFPSRWGWDHCLLTWPPPWGQVLLPYNFSTIMLTSGCSSSSLFLHIISDK
jgi:hypothetical protein